jgi:hypothetical protein
MKNFSQMIAEIQQADRILEADEPLEWRTVEEPGIGCPEEEILAHERRLGTPLPASYRRFLKEVNGCPRLGMGNGGLLSIDKAEWFRENYQFWIDAYTSTIEIDFSAEEHRVYGNEQDASCYRHAYLHDLLQIGRVFDGQVYLLNPRVRDEDGEWEAWNFCNSYPGARRFRSFQDLVENEWQRMLREVRLLSAHFDRDKIISDLLPAIQYAIEVEGVPSYNAIAQHIMRQARVDDSVAALIRQPKGLINVMVALQSKLSSFRE